MLSIGNIMHMIERSSANSEIWCGFERCTHVMARLSDRIRQRHALRQPTGDGSRERASGAMRGICGNTRRFEKLRSRFGNEYIAYAFAVCVTAFHQYCRCAEFAQPLSGD